MSQAPYSCCLSTGALQMQGAPFLVPACTKLTQYLRAQSDTGSLSLKGLQLFLTLQAPQVMIRSRWCTHLWQGSGLEKYDNLQASMQGKTGPFLVTSLLHSKDILGQLLAGLPQTDVCQSTKNFMRVSGLPHHGLRPCSSRPGAQPGLSHPASMAGCKLSKCC